MLPYSETIRESVVIACPGIEKLLVIRLAVSPAVIAPVTAVASQNSTIRARCPSAKRVMRVI